METWKELEKTLLIFFDPMAVLLWIVIAVGTVLVLKKIY